MADKKIDIKQLKADAATAELKQALADHVNPETKPSMEKIIEDLEADLAEVHGEFLKSTTFSRYTAEEIAEIEKLIVEGKLPTKRFQEYKGCLFLVDKDEQVPDHADKDAQLAKLTLKNGMMSSAQHVGSY